MNNTTLTAKNTFLEGLVMDISPESILSNVLTSALNATLVTFNGNELALQNDMGNGRVETANLPEGYIPVGTCEFGDIIYIVSYNPILNKSLIGCFPSPERNIASNELGNAGVSVTAGDFLELDSKGNPTGNLKTTSVKKILFEKYMNSGDKYLISATNLNADVLSDYGSLNHIHNSFPKFIKIHIVSIEDSGKINYLDSDVKWDSNYYIRETTPSSELKLDLDEYRTLVNSAYSIFSSKTSGKLALLIELEKIDSFSCSWEAVPHELKIIDKIDRQEIVKPVSIYWHFNWDSKDAVINPSSIEITKYQWKSGQGEYLEKEFIDNNWVDTTKVIASQIIDPSIPILRIYHPETYIESTEKCSYTDFQNLQTAEAHNIKNINKIDSDYKLYPKSLEDNHNKNNYYINCYSIENSVYQSLINNLLIPIGDDLQENINKGTIKALTDDTANNIFKHPVIKYFGTFNIPIKTIYTDAQGMKTTVFPDISQLVLLYEVTPAMPYGKLEELKLEGFIDFSKLGTTAIKLHTWKYYNEEGASTLTWGLDAYTPFNKKITEVCLEFYDSMGLAAVYHSANKKTYNGTFTDYIPFNNSGVSYKLTTIDHTGKVFAHPKMEVPKDLLEFNKLYVISVATGEAIENKLVTYIGNSENTTYYTNDAGTIYNNGLYLVKVFITISEKDLLGGYSHPEHLELTNRWMWTNTMFNDNYLNTKDFDNLQATLNFDSAAMFSVDTWNIDTVDYKPGPINLSVNISSYETVSATVDKLTGSLNLSLNVGLLDTFNTFALYNSQEGLSKINVDLYLAQENSQNYPAEPKYLYSDIDNTGVNPRILPLSGKLELVSDYFKSLFNKATLNSENNNSDIYDTDTSYQNYKTDLNIDLINPIKTTEEFKYFDVEGNEISLSPTEYQKKSYTLDSLYSKTLKILNTSGFYFSKYCYSINLETKDSPILRSCVRNEADLAEYNLLTWGTKDTIFSRALTLSVSEMDDVHPQYALLQFKSPTQCIGNSNQTLLNHGDKNVELSFITKNCTELVLNNFNLFFPICFNYFRAGNLTIPLNYYNGQAFTYPTDFVNTLNYNSKNLGGTLALIDSAGNWELGDHYMDGVSGQNITSVINRYTPQVLGYLSLIYYIDTARNLETQFIPNNYLYLEPNYYEYTRDLVVKVYLSDKLPQKDINDLLLIHNDIRYSLYLESLIRNSKVSKYNHNNIDISIRNGSKINPITLRFNYKQPTIMEVDSRVATMVLSAFAEVPEKTLLNLDPSKLYYFDNTEKRFKFLSRANTFIEMKNYEWDSDGSLRTSFSSNKTTFKPSLKDCFELKNQTLTTKFIPALSSGTFDIKITNASKHDHSRNLTGLKKDLKFYTK